MIKNDVNINIGKITHSRRNPIKAKANTALENSPDTFKKQDKKPLPKELLKYIGKENLDKIKALNPAMQAKILELYAKCKENSLHFDIVRGLATYEEQKKLYDEMAPIYGVAKTGIPGTTKHEAGLAIDIKVDDSLSNSIKYTQIADIWKKIGGHWGGDDIDEYWHFQWGEG